MKEHHFKFFYDDYVRSWDALNGYVSEGVSDVYIVEEMAFSLATIRQIVGPAVRIRVIPHIAQSGFQGTPAIKKFFVRPDDVDEYDVYVDVFELLNIQNPNSAATMAKIYQDKGWAGKLSEIISDFTLDIDNRNILEMFATHRMHCNHRCMKGQHCTICEQFVSIAETIAEKGFLNDKYQEFSDSN